MSVKVGLDGFAYRNTGTLLSPTWVLMTLVKDITTTLEKGMADLSSRGSGGWRWHKRTLKNFAPEISFIWDNADTNALAILAAFLTDAVVDLLILDNSYIVNGATGPRGQFEVESFPRSEQLEEGMMVNAKFALAYGSVPSWVTVGS